VKAIVALIVIATQLQSQQGTRPSSAIERLRALAVQDDRAALVAAVRDHPDDARELIRRLIVQAGSTRPSVSDSVLTLAQRAGVAYAAAWSDSFPAAQVTRFSAMSRGQRTAKIAADSVRRAGNAALDTRGVDAAIRLWTEALRRAWRIADTAGVAASLGNIGAGFYRASALDSAELYLQRSRGHAEAVGDRRTAANALGTLGSVAKDRGDLRRAYERYTSALRLRSRIGDNRGVAADHNNLGLLSAALGEIADARAHYEEALALARRHALLEPAAAALLNLGNAASADADYAEAGRRYGEALGIYRTSGHQVDAALVLHNLGLLALRRGDYRTALTRLREAVAVFAEVGTASDVVAVRRDLSRALAATGDLRAADRELREAESGVAQLPTDAKLAADVALARAELALQWNYLGEADRHFTRAEALAARAGSAVMRAEAREGKALLLAERRQYTQAIELLESATHILSRAGDRRSAALARLTLGYVWYRTGALDEARKALHAAADSLRAVGDPVGESTALGELGAVHLASGAPLAAEASYRRALSRLGEAMRERATTTWHLRAGLADALRARGALGDAATELRAAVADIERIARTTGHAERRSAFLSDKWDVYAELALVDRARGDVPGAFMASERLRAQQMTDLLGRGRIAPGQSRDSPLIEREQDLRRRIGELTQRLEVEQQEARARRGMRLDGAPGPPSGETREALARAQQEYAETLARLRREPSPLAAAVHGGVVAWRDVASRLSPSDALLEYLVSDSTTVVFVVRHDTLLAIDLGVGRSTLEPLIDFARGTLGRPAMEQKAARSSESWRAPLRRLHEYLIAPVEAAGALRGARRLILVAHVELHYLPFAALIGRASGHQRRDSFLIERYDLTFAPSATVWTQLGNRTARPTRGLLALAPRTRALPGTRDEVAALRSLYGSEATVLLDTAASEAAFAAAAPAHEIIHLATFGVLNKHNPLFSFVSLNPASGADGRLEVHEVSALTLNARLLVLSACQTGLASGQLSDVPAGGDWVGLVRAFLNVGARNVIATLWPIEDRSTASFMGQLHRRLRAGESEAAALAAAQRAALRDPATADPFYWAGFVLVGGR
jgi:CHAT domain-containing protein